LTTFGKIFIALTLIIISACSSSPALPENQNLSPKPSTGQITCVSILKGQFKIDTANILRNKNLPTLIADLGKSDLRDKDAVTDIPDFVKAFLDSISPEKKFSIANPHEDFKAGCTNLTVLNEKGDTLLKPLPGKQMVYLGLNANMVLLSYYTGGLGKAQHIALIKFQNNRVVDFWFKNNIAFTSSKEELLRTIRQEITTAHTSYRQSSQSDKKI
jgi:hypothetical protein